jgi:hypothetical protein
MVRRSAILRFRCRRDDRGKFTTNKSTLTVAVSGTFDTASGGFSASGPVAASTGKLAGATGNLDLTGKENLADGSFVETVTGSVCANLNG